MARGITGSKVGGGGTAPPPSALPEHVQARDIQPHAVVTKPNGMGRLAGAPRGHRELPKPIIPTPTQNGRRIG